MHVPANGAGTAVNSQGAVGYDPSTDAAYASTFGAGLSMRKITGVGTAPLSTVQFSESQLQQFLRDGNPDRSVLTPIISGIVLNPLPVGAFPAYSFAIITDIGTTRLPASSTNDPAATKRLYRYNLQAVGPAGTPAPPYGDARDLMTTLVTLSDLNAAKGAAPTNTSSNFGRQGAFSTDGQSYYSIDSATALGGVYKTDVLTGATSLIVAMVVTRLATLVERRDRALLALRERRDRDAHLVSLGTLAAGAAHELSTPLGTIAVAARELERSLDDTPGAEARHADVRLIRAEIERCKRVLQDMAGRSGTLTGEAPTPQPLSNLEAGLLAQLSADERGRVDVSLPSTVTTCWPAGAVARALANLVRNGIQASQNGGRVSLSARLEDDRVMLTIVDRGIGMSTAVQGRAGEPFFTTRAEGAGMGLGLFVTMSTIDQLGGTMRLSSAEGVGTTITITLPQDAAQS